MGQQDASKRPSAWKDIFISYSSTNRAKVAPIVAALEGEFKVFWDQHIMSGNWEDRLQEALFQAVLVLGFESKAAWASKEVRPEFNRGLKNDALILVQLEACDNAMYRYDNEQRIDFTQWIGAPDAPEIHKLKEAVRERLQDLIQRWLTRNPTIEPDPAEKPPGPQSADTREDDRGGKKPDAGAPAAPVAADLSRNSRERVAQRRAAEPTPANLLDESPISPPDPQADLGLGPDAWSLKGGAALASAAVAAVGLEPLLRAARSGYADAQAAMGLGYRHGVGGMPLNDAAAVRWLERAAEQNFPRAQAELADLLALLPPDGLVDVSVARIEALSRAGAQAGLARAKTLRALIWLNRGKVKLTDADAVALLESAVRDGDMLAIAELGYRLMRGGRGVRTNQPRGVEMIRRAAQGGHPRAMTYLGELYAFGRGLNADPARAVHWFREAGKANDAWGQYYLGKVHEVGYGMPKDTSAARGWYKKACDQGDIDSMITLAEMYLSGRGGPREPAKAIELLERVSQEQVSRSPEADRMLGELYEAGGPGVAQDIAKAVQCFTAAADEDDAEAQWRLGLLYETGRGVGRDLDQAKSWFRSAALNAPNRAFFRRVRDKLAFHGVALRTRASN